MIPHSHRVALFRIRCGTKQILTCNRASAPLDPGHWTLPWVELEDAPPPIHPIYCGIESHTAAASQRLFRQLGIDRLEVNSITPITHIESPPWHPIKLNAHLVEIELNETCKLGVEGPFDEAIWLDLDDINERWSSGAYLLNPLTRAILCGTTEEWAQWPHEEPLPDLRVIPVRSHTLPPASHTNAFLIGGKEPILIDPSPANEAAYEKLVAQLEATRPARIFVTHHHPDHHQQLPRLARHLRLPVLASADTIDRIVGRFGNAYWDDIELQTASDEDTVGFWRGRQLRAFAVPGHDAGQMAIAPVDMSWMIVGDLIQGVGTVVIAEPEGDMAAYFESLRWVIEKNPKVIIPSHGQAMGSCFRIEQTLRHRLQREADVLAMHEAGLGVEDMLAKLYANVDRRLWGLARMNIQSHLKKLRNEGRLQS